MNEKYMNMAIELAKQAKGKVYTNPLVGCVIVKNNEVVGKGWHKYFGGNHAEVEALNDAGEDAKGADVYVTLEPCNSYGKRPPCTLALVKAGIKRVFFSLEDANVSGSREILEKNGIEVYSGLLQKESKILLQDYFKFLRTKPIVSVKAGISLDGKIATYTHDSKWITSDKSRNLVHKIRSTYDAVLIGSNTALIDNPVLTSHSKNLKNPVRVVIDSNLKIPQDYNLFDGTVPTVIVYDSKIKDIPSHLSNGKWIILAPVDMKAAKEDFSVIIKKLNSLSLKRILIEGGSEIISSALFSNTVYDIYLFVAPKIVGGQDAISVVGGSGVKKISDALDVKKVKIKKVGNDFLITGRIGENKNVYRIN
ncbi:MAG: bifunctional diaminohydroxyphosphoribosylaminopyrimidine deaminase/5-amino-6-(5-phosphoribosylamino)uracil reductase RibD [Endomicrobium sp.]|jgi:diaminohydroxyphosphoribosylaminopyrimidine deaminase/5-amino-6-(5-phosphoribosylamino)uracil reductase|nr:bifunctional diaminohydroxyphosphoribosylaminopyrimidine deaminase/5-amino-6-(5-phosphoribosylamino)uracil reductase RibD [Endomicrobium sp.]